jgi:hypothetical protein
MLTIAEAQRRTEHFPIGQALEALRREHACVRINATAFGHSNLFGSKLNAVFSRTQAWSRPRS